MVEALIEQFGRDQLTVEELESRLDRAHRTTDRDELRALLADLPALDTQSGFPARVHDPRSGVPAGRSEGSEVAAEGGERAAPSVTRKLREFIVAFWSGTTRKGGWRPARFTTVLAFQGGAELDFREAVLPPGVTDVRAAAVMGAVEIVVPPWVRVEESGLGIMGAFEAEASVGEGPDGMHDPDAPVLRITGFAVMGAVEVQVRLPGETPKEARTRRKAAAKTKAFRRTNREDDR